MEDRLLKLLDAEQLSSAKFADVIGVQRSSISHILSGRNKPSFDFLQKTLIAFPMINADWLILGKGNMYEGEVNTVSGSLFDQVPVNKSENVKNQLDSLNQPTSVENDYTGKVPAGDDISDRVDPDSEIPYVKSRTNASVGQREGENDMTSDAGISNLHDDQDTISKSANNGSKIISRVIVFYTDKSFESYEKAD